MDVHLCTVLTISCLVISSSSRMRTNPGKGRRRRTSVRQATKLSSPPIRQDSQWGWGGWRPRSTTTGAATGKKKNICGEKAKVTIE
ncbi:hypothetical protein P167DRAFT_29111 [Morchella conica CCBAS932]|uniref:Secreted protein n=1 Tax=Morchella conica CCBAS932 TaxID=1392247 RepID=A0A3N4KWQ5_9PEZI|nr:hypothetical protein P167DRAFT_29111 [Morchella conica CCBAS932]